MSPPMKSLITMTQSRLAKGKTSPSKYTKQPAMMYAPMPAVVKNLPTAAEARPMTKATKPGVQDGEVSDGKHSVLIVCSAVLVGFRSRCSGLEVNMKYTRPAGDLSRSVAVT